MGSRKWEVGNSGSHIHSVIWKVYAAGNFCYIHQRWAKKGRIHRKQRDVCATRRILTNIGKLS